MIKRLKGLWVKLVDYSNEKGVAEKLKTFWSQIWGNEPAKVDISIFNDDERFHILNNEKIKQYWEDEKRYQKEKAKLGRRRLFVGLVLTFFVCTIIGNIFYEVYGAIRGNYLLNCLGREVCIYRGPKLKYPDYYFLAKNLGNGNVLIFNGSDYNLLYHKLVYPFKIFIPSGIPMGVANKIFETDIKFAKSLYGYKYITAQLYTKAHNKIVPISITPEALAYLKTHSSKTFIFNDHEHNGYILPHCIDNLVFFNSYKKLLELHETKNNFHQEYKKLNLTFIKQYDTSRMLGISKFDLREGIFNHKHAHLARLYLIDLKRERIEPLPPFSKTPKFYPREEDIKILNNGKIIVPIRAITLEDEIVWDHIEIYDPKTNKFVVELNTKALEQNLFDFELPNGDILFINKHSSWIFNNKTNQFNKTSFDDEVKYQAAVIQIETLLMDILETRLSEPIQNDIKYIKIAPDKYLITCRPLDKSSRCKNTIYYNYSDNKITKGPKFLYPHRLSKVVNVNEYETFVIGGEPKLRFNSMNSYNLLPPYPYIQIIKVNN